MFEIHGFFTENNLLYIDRLSKNLTTFYTSNSIISNSDKQYQGQILNLTTNYINIKDNIHTLNHSKTTKTVILPPITKIIKCYSDFCDKIIINFNCLEDYKPSIHPNITTKELTEILENLTQIKDKCLVQLSGNCYDYTMTTHTKNILTNNQATLKAIVHSSEIYYDEISGNSYFTYLGENSVPHFVWLEDTKSLSVKHNLIKEYGFCGICWENPYIVSEGNWESMYMAYEKR